VLSNGSYKGISTTANSAYCGGNCSDTANSVEGGALFQGGDTSGTGSAAAGGYAVLRGGMLTAGSPNSSALMGVAELGAGYLKSTVANIGDVVCGTATAFMVTDCNKTGPAVNIVGIATSTSNPISVVTDGLAPVKLSTLSNIGDTVCMGTATNGQAADNGLAACATAGTTIGVIVADSGTIIIMSGNSTASVTLGPGLPLVQLHIGK
jgi:hypothetical protein